MKGFFVLHFLIISVVISSSALFFYSKITDIYYYKMANKKINTATHQKKYHTSKLYSSLDETGVEIGTRNYFLTSINKNYHDISTNYYSLHTELDVNNISVLSKPTITFEENNIYINNHKVILKSNLGDNKIISFSPFYFDKKAYVVFRISDDERLLIVELDSTKNYLNDFICFVGIQTKYLIVCKGEKYFLMCIYENLVIQYFIQEEKIIECKKREFSSKVLHAKPLYHLSDKNADYIYFMVENGKIMKSSVIDDYQIEVGYFPHIISFEGMFIIYSYALNSPLICFFNKSTHNLLVYAELNSYSLESVTISNLSLENYVEIIPYGEYLLCLTTLNYRYDKVYLDDYLSI